MKPAKSPDANADFIARELYNESFFTAAAKHSLVTVLPSRSENVGDRKTRHRFFQLERNGMVSRTVMDGRVLGVEYALTPLGRSLQGPFFALFEWTVENMAEIENHQRRYDAR